MTSWDSCKSVETAIEGGGRGAPAWNHLSIFKFCMFILLIKLCRVVVVYFKNFRLRRALSSRYSTVSYFLAMFIPKKVHQLFRFSSLLRRGVKWRVLPKG